VEPTRYRIVVAGRLSERFVSSLDGVRLEDGLPDSALVGEFADQAQLYGLLNRLSNLGLKLVSVNAVR
jgi:hypothetical protein